MSLRIFSTAFEHEKDHLSVAFFRVLSIGIEPIS